MTYITRAGYSSVVWPSAVPIPQSRTWSALVDRSRFYLIPFTFLFSSCHPRFLLLYSFFFWWTAAGFILTIFSSLSFIFFPLLVDRTAGFIFSFLQYFFCKFEVKMICNAYYAICFSGSIWSSKVPWRKSQAV